MRWFPGDKCRQTSALNRPRVVAEVALLVLLLALAVEYPFAAEKSSRTKTGFVPPTSEQRRAAIGSLKSLKPEVQRAFSTQDFLPLEEPQPGEWLAEHVETGQPFDMFVKSRPNRPDAERNRIYMQPLGEFDPEWSPDLAALSDCAAAFFQMEVKVLPEIPLDEKQVKSRDRDGWRQYLTTDLMQVLKSQLPADAYCIVGVTMKDLYPDPAWNYVFGQASLRDRVGVYSFARYDPHFWGEKRTPETKKLLLKRSCGVLVHETSHMFGMKHCVYFQCVVNGSNGLNEADGQPLHLCPVCLRKLQHSVGFDVVTRYRALRDIYRRIGLDDEADWINHRLALISGPEKPK